MAINPIRNRFYNFMEAGAPYFGAGAMVSFGSLTLFLTKAAGANLARTLLRIKNGETLNLRYGGASLRALSQRYTVAPNLLPSKILALSAQVTSNRRAAKISAIALGIFFTLCLVSAVCYRLNNNEKKRDSQPSRFGLD